MLRGAKITQTSGFPSSGANLPCLKVIMSNMLKRLVSISLQPHRTFKSDLKMTWIKPEPVLCYDTRKSGDLEALALPNPDKPAVPEDLLKDQPEAIKQVFSIGHTGRKSAMELYTKELMDRVRKHKYDTDSEEVKIARWTAIIRGLQGHLQQFPRDGQQINICKQIIDKRKKHMKFLREADYKRFEWLLEKLQLEYKPAPPAFKLVTRKQSMSKLKDIYCEEQRAKKMAEYKEKLLKEREALLKQFAENPLPPLKREEFRIKTPETLEEIISKKIEKSNVKHA